MKKIFISITLLFLILSNTNLFSQCGCPGNSSSIGILPLGELTNIDSVVYDNLFINLLTKFNFADSYYSETKNMGPGPIKAYKTGFSSFRLGYKPLEKLILETEIGYFIYKSSKEVFNNLNSSGLSDLTFTGRYSLLKDKENGWEFSIGTGLRIPLTRGDISTPQNIQPSTGAYAVLGTFIIKKVFPEIKSALVFAHRTDINFKNYYDYKYGNSFYSSLVFLNNIFENTVVGVELRNEIRLKDFDYIKSEILESSGMKNIILTPLIRYSIGDIMLNLACDLPLYQYYNGFQIANKFGFSLNVSYATKI